MLLRQVLELFDYLDTPAADGGMVTALLKERGAAKVHVETVTGEEGDTDCITVLIQGSEGKSPAAMHRHWALSDVLAAWEQDRK